jgi:hypothetical protein
MDLEVALTPMPEDYRRKRVRVRCYECRQESDTPFHVVRLKCKAVAAACGGSYNTVKIGEAPDAEEEDVRRETLEEMLEAFVREAMRSGPFDEEDDE